MSDTPSSIEHMIDRFVAATIPLERHLLEDHPITDQQLDRIAQTVAGMQTIITVWKTKRGRER